MSAFDTMMATLVSPDFSMGDFREAVESLTDPAQMREWFTAYVSVVGIGYPADPRYTAMDFVLDAAIRIGRDTYSRWCGAIEDRIALPEEDDRPTGSRLELAAA